MMHWRRLAEACPWLGMLVAALGWGLSHQLGSDSLFDDCRSGGFLFVLAICLLGLALTIAGGLFSFGIWRGDDQSEGRRFIGLLGACLAGLASFAILLQVAAAAILPRCVS